MQILDLKPATKEIIWGGQRLTSMFPLPEGASNIAEAWLLSCHPAGPCTVASGADAGLTLQQAIEKHGAAVLGTKCSGMTDFPLLIKFIDAKERLSVQVHPDNAYARIHENENGKTEAWYILDCTENAELIYGFDHTVSKEECRHAIEDGNLLSLCNRVRVKPGDVAFIPSGTLHAIGGGILLAEVQQSSNVTYRVFDYNRIGKDGKPRELHVDKALDVLELSRPQRDFSPEGQTEEADGYSSLLLASCDYFRMTRLAVRTSAQRTATDESFVSLLVTDGNGFVEGAEQSIPVQKGSSLFIPAGFGAFTIQGKMQILETRV